MGVFVTLEDLVIVAPTQKSRQCLDFWISQVHPEYVVISVIGTSTSSLFHPVDGLGFGVPGGIVLWSIMEYYRVG